MAPEPHEPLRFDTTSGGGASGGSNRSDRSGLSLTSGLSTLEVGEGRLRNPVHVACPHQRSVRLRVIHEGEGTRSSGMIDIG